MIGRFICWLFGHKIKLRIEHQRCCGHVRTFHVPFCVRCQRLGDSQ